VQVLSYVQNTTKEAPFSSVLLLVREAFFSFNAVVLVNMQGSMIMRFLIE
jgi:hypothetical protein